MGSITLIINIEATAGSGTKYMQDDGQKRGKKIPERIVMPQLRKAIRYASGSSRRMEARKRELDNAQEMLGLVFCRCSRSLSRPVTRPCHHPYPLASTWIWRDTSNQGQTDVVRRAAVWDVSNPPQEDPYKVAHVRV